MLFFMVLLNFYDRPVSSKRNDHSIISGRTVFQMLFYTALMVIVPISSYFITR